MDFMDKSFALIENSTSEGIRQEVSSADTHMSSEETSINSGLVSCFDALLHQVHLLLFPLQTSIHQADDQLQLAAVAKLESFLRGRILEPKVAGRIASGMARTCAKIAPATVLSAFLPLTCSTLTSCLADTDLASSLPLGDEIMFHLLLLSDLLCLPGCHLLPYIPLLEDVFRPTLSLANREGHALALTALRHALHSLTHPCLAERSRIVASPSPCALHDWGAPSDLSNLGIKWFLPGLQEFEAASRLLGAFLEQEVASLEDWLAGGELDREAMLRSLKTVSTLVTGSSPVLPPWQEEALCMQETKVEFRPRTHTVLPKENTFNFKFRCDNARKTLASLMERLVVKVLEEREDDTKTLNAIINVLKLLMFQHSISEESYDKHSKNFYQSKAKLEVRLFGAEKHIRAILLDRVLLQHEKRLVDNTHQPLTATSLGLLRLLVTLGTSHYSKVRVQAQTVLAKALKGIPYAYNAILEQVLPLIQANPEVVHEQMKGALYIILQNQLLVKHSWTLQARLWPALVTAPHSEKPSITALVKSVASYIHSVDTWTVTWPEVAEEVREMARSLGGRVEEEEAEAAKVEISKKGEENLENYHKLVSLLCDLVEEGGEEGSLHWRRYNTSLTMLCAMLRHDVDFPIRAVTIFTNNLVHENVLVRKASLHVIDCVMKKTKRAHPKIKLSELPSSCGDSGQPPGEAGGEGAVAGGLAVRPGEREDNKFLQYSPVNRPLTEEMWEQNRFVHKTWAGYYVWPQEEVRLLLLLLLLLLMFLHLLLLQVIYAPSSQQPKLDREEQEMHEAERVVFRFLSQEDKVERLVTFLCLEHKKGQDRFDAERFAMFKGVFRNFGDSFLPCFRGHIERLVQVRPQDPVLLMWTLDILTTLMSMLMSVVILKPMSYRSAFNRLYNILYYYFSHGQRR